MTASARIAFRSSLHTADHALCPEPVKEGRLARPLRVLHIYKSWSPDAFGGVEQIITTLCAGGWAYGIEGRVAYLARGNRVAAVRHQGIAAYRFPVQWEIASTGLSLPFLLGYRRLATWADLLHFHFPWPFGDLVHRLSGISTPFLVTYHLDITRQRVLEKLYAPLRGWLLRRADRIIATSDNYVQSSPVLRTFRHKTMVIPLGIEDAERGTAHPIRTAYWRHRLGKGFVLFVGVLRYYKGLHVLLEAAPAIVAPIVIVGSGPCEQALKRQARNSKLRHVTFVGEVDSLDKDALFRLSGLFVFPSNVRSEAFGLALLEASMYGKPSVSCELGTGSSLVNLHEETGLVVAPDNAHELSTAVNRLLSDREERERLGTNARNRYLKHFTADSMVSRYAEEYHRAAAESVAWKR
ncbi:MAG TPA: glycosyltransferase [Nitrospira sp.]|nr:glycosyltransferase [Nitrospira sp.]